MKRTFYTITIIVSLIIIVFSLTCCDKQTDKTSLRTLKSTEDSINAMRLFTDLLTLQQNFLTTLVNSSIDTATLRRLLDSEEYDSIYLLLGLDSNKVNTTRQKMLNDADSLLILLSELRDTTGCHCGDTVRNISSIILTIQNFRDNPEHLEKLSTSINSMLSGDYIVGSGCHWAQYAACDAECLFVCIGDMVCFAICHTWCWCEYCWGGAHEYVCWVFKE